INNQYVVALGGDGAFDILAGSTTDLVIDVTGYYDNNPNAGLSFSALPAPVRLLDTRNIAGLVGCDVGGALPLVAGIRTESVVGACTGIAAGVAAVLGNVAATNSSSGGYIALFPSSLAQPPTVSNLNYLAGETINGAFVAGLGSDGAL